jgi:hypothetical protein
MPPFLEDSDRRAHVLFAQGLNTITLGLQHAKQAGDKRYILLAKENIVSNCNGSFNVRFDVKCMETRFKY